MALLRIHGCPTSLLRSVQVPSRLQATSHFFRHSRISNELTTQGVIREAYRLSIISTYNIITRYTSVGSLEFLINDFCLKAYATLCNNDMNRLKLFIHRLCTSQMRFVVEENRVWILQLLQALYIL